MAHYQIVAGTTAALRFQLLEGGNPIDLSGDTVALLLSNNAGTTIAAPGTVTVTDATNGKVQLAPASTTVFDATLSPYLARWKITDSGGNIFYIPTGSRDVWNIVGA